MCNMLSSVENDLAKATTLGRKKRKQLLIFPYVFFLTSALCLSAGRGVLRLTRLPRQDRGPVSGEESIRG